MPATADGQSFVSTAADGHPIVLHYNYTLHITLCFFHHRHHHLLKIESYIIIIINIILISVRTTVRSRATAIASLRLAPEQFLLLYRELGADDYGTASRQVSEEEEKDVSFDVTRSQIKTNEIKTGAAFF